MGFSKSFPRTKDKFPVWEEVHLEDDEEREQERISKEEHVKLMKDSIDMARKIIKEKEMKEYQTDVVNIAISLFEKQASHQVYWKENKAKEKFDELFKEG